MSALHVAILRLSQKAGNARLWLEGRRVSDAGFTPGLNYSVKLDKKTKTLTLRLTEQVGRRVHRKTRGGIWIPVIDIANSVIDEFFGPADTIRVVFGHREITITLAGIDKAKHERFDRLIAKLKSGTPLAAASVCHGGGILDHAVHTGLAEAGIDSRLAIAIELDPTYLDASLKNNSLWRDGTRAIQGDLMDIDREDLADPQHAGIDLLISGLPCTGASRAGKHARNHAAAEAHPQSGHLFIGFIELIQAMNPAIILIENVEEYAETIGYDLLQRVLKQRGYAISKTTINGTDHGALEARRRICVIASTGSAVNLDNLPTIAAPATLGAYLDEIPAEDPRWKDRQNLRDRADRNAAKGLNFKSHLVDRDSQRVHTITSGYMFERGYEDMVRHPTDGSRTRLFTPAEHARIKTVPEDLIKGLHPRTAHEILGQGVIHRAFVTVGHRLGEHLSALTMPAAA